MSCGSSIDQRQHASNASQLSYAARDGVAAFGRMAHLLDSGKRVCEDSCGRRHNSRAQSQIGLGYAWLIGCNAPAEPLDLA